MSRLNPAVSTATPVAPSDRTPPIGPTAASSPRLIVLHVSLSEDTKTLRVIDTRSNSQFDVLLRHDWFESPVNTGNVVRVVLVNANGTYLRWATVDHLATPVTVDMHNNFFILHPDTLVSGTIISDSFYCLRKSVISALTPPSFELDSAVGQASQFGSMIHDIFQNVLVLDSNTRDYSTPEELSQRGGVDIMSFYEVVEDVVNRNTDELFAASIPVPHARLVLHKVVPNLVEWYRSFMGSGNFHDTQGVPISVGKKTQHVIVTKVHDIEELVWSPIFGITGKIDASVHLRIDGEDCGIAVLELKSGKSDRSSGLKYAAQIMLYTLLLSERSGAPVVHGLLTYLRYQEALQSVRADASQGVAAAAEVGLVDTCARFGQGAKHRVIVPLREELVGLLAQRNKLAAHLRADCDVEDLPPLLSGAAHKCEKCFAADTCLMHHKLLEGGTAESVQGGPGEQLFAKKAGHLNARHAEYFHFWRDVLADEEEHVRREGRNLWATPAVTREKHGQCAANLQLVSDDPDCTQTSPHELLTPGQRVVAHFKRRLPPHISESNGAKAVAKWKLSVGNFVVISAERRHGESQDNVVVEATETWQCSLANGFIQSISKDTISVTVDRSLAAWVKHQGLQMGDVIWRIDAEEIYKSYRIAKNSLAALFFGEDYKPGMQRLRELIVDGEPPRFVSSESVSIYTGDNIVDNAVKELNEDQKLALEMSMRAKDYTLILGMPGTGKTMTLATIVMAHARRGRSVLLCSYTHSAVDNLLMRLLDLGYTDFVRLGTKKEAVDSRIHDYLASTLLEQTSKREEAERALLEARVVATTCLGITDSILQRRDKFDLVVIDEASQMLQPICIGPLQLATDGTFVLVGDHYQLPPLQRAGPGVGRRLTDRMTRVKTLHGAEGNAMLSDESNKEKRLRGVDRKAMRSDESLFRRLCERHSEAMVLLKKQYRMTQDIMAVCNEIVYGGSLQCGNAEIAQQLLQTKYMEMRETESNEMEGVKKEVEGKWREAVRDPHQKVVFLDTGEAAENTEGPSGSGTTNENEGKLATECVKMLTRDGLRGDQVGVLSVYRGQVELIERLLRDENEQGECQGCKVWTVDRYQGKDNDCVIVSFVRPGPLLKDWRRINVAVTRAKCKLILVGSCEALCRAGAFLRQMVGWLKRKNVVWEARC